MASSGHETEQMGFDFGVEKSDPANATEARQVSCLHCNKTLAVPAWYAEQGLHMHFCGSACRQAWTAETPSFEVKPQKRRGHRGGNWTPQANKARERDGFACQVCARNEEQLGRQLDVHHLIPYKNFKSNIEANRLENLISLCPSCHAKMESQLRRELPLFQGKE
jgi:5-methylcytosine-specific restriction endonuclease McrA